MKLKISMLFLFFSFTILSQSLVDGLVKDLENTTDLENKKTLVLKIVDYYQEITINNDSVSKYISTIIPINNDSLFYAEILYRRGKLHNKNSNFDASIKSTEKAAQLFEKYNEEYKRAKAKSLQGSVYQAMFKNQLALQSYNATKDILKGKDRIQLLSGYGAVYSQLNALDKSIAYYNKAYKASIEQNYDKFLFNIHNGMAVVYFKNNNPEKSKESLKKALEAAKKDNYILGQLVCLHNLGHKFQTEGNYTQAIAYFEEAIVLIDKVDYKLIEGQIYYKYADCLIVVGDLYKASIYADKAEMILGDMESSGRLPYALRTKAKIEKKLGNTNNAISILKEAITISATNEISSITSDLYLFLAENYKDQNNAQLTYEAYKNHIRIKDSLSNRKKSAEIETVKEQFEASERENKLEQDNKLLEEKNTTSFYRNILLAFALIGLIFFLYRQRRINKAKQKVLQQEKEIISLNEELLKDKVKHKNSQITEYAILIDERNKFLDAVKFQINKIRDLSSDSDQKRKINDLQFYIKDNISVNKEKIDLDKKGITSEESFRFNLEQRFTKLTDTEITICRLLKLNLTSKQIAQKMDITVQSVNNYRSSIRKKIDLETGQNLKRFLKNV